MIAKTHKDLDVYKQAFEAAVKIFEISKSFPKEETYFYPVKYDFYMGYPKTITTKMFKIIS